MLVVRRWHLQLDLFHSEAEQGADRDVTTRPGIEPATSTGAEERWPCPNAPSIGVAAQAHHGLLDGVASHCERHSSIAVRNRDQS